MNRYEVLHADGRVVGPMPSGEARLWAWIGMVTCWCDVFKVGGVPVPLTPFDIIPG